MKPRQLTTLILAPLQFLASAFHPLTGLGRSVGGMATDAPSAATPAGYAFSIWMVIFTLTTLYALHQARRSEANNPLYRAIGWPLAATMGLGSVWMLYAQLYGNGLTLLTIILLMGAGILTALLIAVRHHTAQLVSSPFYKYVIVPMLGLFGGWLTLAMFLNLGSGLYLTIGFPPTFLTSTALGTLLASATLGLVILSRLRRSPLTATYYGLTLVWGLLAVAVTNTPGNPFTSPILSYPVGLMAIFLSCAILAYLARLK